MVASARILAVVVALTAGTLATGGGAAGTPEHAAPAAGLRPQGTASATGSPVLAGDWHLDTLATSDTGSTTPDSSGNGLDAQVVQVNQALVPGRFGSAFNLAAASAAVVATSTSAVGLSSPLAALEPAQVTVVAWVKQSASPGQYRYVVAKGARACAAASYALYTGASGGLSFYVDAGAAAPALVSPDAGPGVWDGQWHMVAGVFDGSTARLYVDGTQVGSGTSGAATIDYAAADARDLDFGSYPSSSCGDTSWGGQLDELRVYASALSSSDLHYLGTFPGATPPTLPQPTAPASTPPVNTTAPAIAGAAIIGGILTCSTGTWSGSPTGFSYQWERDSIAVPGETGAAHVVTAEDVGHALTCQVTATGAGGSAAATSAAVTSALAVPSAVLNPVSRSAAAGSPVQFDAGSSDLYGATANSYRYAFSNGATANCATGKPLLSAVFDAPLTGKVDLVVRTAAGASAAVSSTFSVGHKTASGRTAVGRARLVSYACSATAATNPHARTSVGNLRRPCLEPSTVDGGYVEMTGCIGVLPMAALTTAERRALPWDSSVVRNIVLGRADDTSADVFYTAYDQVLINGLVVTPAKGHAVILAAAGGKGDTELAQPNGYYIASGDATVAVYAKGAPSIPLASGRISWNVSSGTGPNGAPQVNGHPPVRIQDVTLATATAVALPGAGWLLGQVVALIPGADPLLSTLAFAYPAEGDYVTNVPIDLTNLPFRVNDTANSQGATAAVMFQTSNAAGLQLGEFSLTIPDAFFGSVEIKDISLTYTRAGGAGLPTSCQPGKGKAVADALTGAAKTDIASGTLSAKVVVCNVGSRPALKLFHIDYQGNLQVVPDIIYLTRASGDLDTDTGTLVVNAHLSILAGSVANGCGLAGAYGQMTIKTDPFSLTANGNAETLCVQAGGPGNYLHLDGHGYFSEGSYIDYDLGDLGSLKGSVSGEGYFAPSDGQYHVRLDGDVELSGNLTSNAFGLGNLTAKAHAVISDVGLAACSSIDTPWHTYHVGFGARYSPSDIFSYPGGALKYLADNLDFKGDGCDTNDYSRIPAIAGGPAPADATTSAVDYGFTVPTGQQVTVVLLHGKDAAPGAILHGPGGRTLDVSQPGPKASLKALVVQLPHAKETEVQLFGAHPGRWTVTPAPSAPAISSVEVSSDLGKPVITGRVTGHGATRTLHYQVQNVPAGTKVAFVENGVRGGGLLGRATGTVGTLMFTPSAARAGARTIVAQLTAPDGTPRGSITVARYSAVAPAPGKPSRLRIRHVGRTLVITFAPGASATSQRVSVQLSDGRRLVFAVGGRARGVTVRGVTTAVHATSVVVYEFRDGVAGPALSGHGG